MHRVSSHGVDPSVNFLMTQMLHISIYSSTRRHQSCTHCTCRRHLQSFEQSNISCRRNLLFKRFRFCPNSDCICTNSTYTFSVPSVTRGVCRFLSKKRETSFELIHYVRDFATKIARNVFTLRLPSVSCPYEGRGMDPVPIYIFAISVNIIHLLKIINLMYMHGVLTSTLVNCFCRRFFVLIFFFSSFSCSALCVW